MKPQSHFTTLFAICLAILHCRLANAEIKSGKTLLRTLAVTTSNEVKIEMIDREVARFSIGSTDNESLVQISDIRALACLKAPEQCLKVESWAPVACGTQFQTQENFFKRLWASTFEALKKENDGLTLWSNIKKCSTTQNLGQLSVLAPMLHLAASKRWGRLSHSILTWSTQNFKGPADDNLSDSLEVINDLIEGLQKMPSPPTRIILRTSDIAISWIEAASANERQDSQVSRFVNTAVGPLSMGGAYSQIDRLGEAIVSLVTPTNKELNSRTFINEYCNATRELSKPEPCRKLIAAFFGSDLDFDSRVILARSELEKGNFAKANRELNELLKRSDLTLNWKPWIIYLIALTNIYSGNLDQAEKDFNQHELSLGQSKQKVEEFTYILKARILRARKEYAKATAILQPLENNLDKSTDGPFYKKLTLDFEVLLNAVALNDAKKIRQSIARVKTGFAGDASETFRKSALVFFEKRLQRQDYTQEWNELLKIKGSTHPDAMEVKIALGQTPTLTSKPNQ